MALEDIQLQEHVEKGFKELGYKGSTTILENTIPAIFNQQDVIVIGEENQERRLSYLLPLISNIVSGPHGHLRVLIVAATQQAAIEIHDLIRQVGEKARLRSVLLNNRDEILEQIQTLRQGVEIAVACPNRLIQILERGGITLTHIETLVLDGAEQLIIQGMFVQVKKILRRLPIQRQNLLYANSLTNRLQNFRNEVTKHALLVNPGNVNKEPSSAHILYPINPNAKDKNLAQLINQHRNKNHLIVTWSIQRTSQIIEKLKENNINSIFFDPSRKQGNQSDGDYKLSEKVFVTCEPISQPNYREYFDVVIFYDLPKSPQQYMRHTRSHTEVKQNIRFISLVTNEDTASVRKIERILGKKFEKMNPSQQRHSRGQRSGRNQYRGKSGSQRNQNRRSGSNDSSKPGNTQNNQRQHPVNRQNKKTIK
ncbi:MAG: DEAD/DEAH box helicase [Anaerolineaceae bacterium]|nr:DEAD/DEAH box helicase [Anaerolineaceae bacterium]